MLPVVQQHWAKRTQQHAKQSVLTQKTIAHSFPLPISVSPQIWDNLRDFKWHLSMEFQYNKKSLFPIIPFPLRYKIPVRGPHMTKIMLQKSQCRRLKGRRRVWIPINIMVCIPSFKDLLSDNKVVLSWEALSTSGQRGNVFLGERTLIKDFLYVRLF